MTRPRVPEAVRLFSRVVVDESTGCWEWQGTRNERGYGNMWNGQSKKEPTHRIAYRLLVGPIPDGLHMDHLCRNPPCCNPDHLEPVTPAENVRRGARARETCAQGHPYTPENTYTAPGTGWRSCRICRDASAAERNPVGAAARAAERAAARAQATCAECGAPQPTRRKLGRYCSDRCGQRYRKRHR